jgi:transposase InsO family protein
MVKRPTREREQDRKSGVRLRRIQHYEQVTRNVSRTCRFFGISRGQFYVWLRRYQLHGLAGLRDGKPGPKHHPFATPEPIVALILRIRQERQYGPRRICLYLRRYHQTYVSPNTIFKILKRHHAPRVSLKRYRPGPRRRREFERPGQSVQVDVKHLQLDAGRFYQFTAIDEATRYRVLKIYDHLTIKNAVEFVDEVRRRLSVAIERIQTDHGAEFGTDFTWHLRDLGIAHRHIPPGCPECNGKVERSHRTDEDEFYRRSSIRDAADLARKLKRWEREYNERRPHLALAGATPAERLCELKIAQRPVQMTA